MVAADEAELIGRATQGDRQAFAELYDRYGPRVYRYVFYIVHETADAEDLTAQTFLKAWESIRRFQARGRPFSAWLLRIAHNLTVNHVRRSPKSRSNSRLREENLFVAHVASSPHDAHERRSRSELLAQALSRLPSEQREVIVLRFVEALGHRDIARILGKTVTASRALQYRALVSLRVHVRDLEEADVRSGGEKRRAVQARQQRAKIRKS